ncbi:MAG: efflux RND transporter periplasmic adaptor subunit [Eubacteriales bacterium]|nr:efflux RND transporter periplasmic adaptor subunit [Eubacteriales bacterium]
MKINRRKKLGTVPKVIIAVVSILIIIGIIAGVIAYRKSQTKSATSVSSNNIGTVARGSISNELTSSGTLSPKDTYTITSLVSGEIVTADFSEGDQVEKGQTLYVIDQSDIVNDIDSAERSLSTAQTSYDDAVRDNADAVRKYNGGTYLSTESGYIKNITMKTGDNVGGQNGTKIAEVYSDQQMTVRMAFLNTEADALAVGQDIVVELTDTGEQIPGLVKNKSDLLETVEGGVLVKNVEILVTNPGGLTTSDRATAFTGNIYSVGDGAFEAIKTIDLKVDLPSAVKVNTVLCHEGEYISVGTPLFTIDAESLTDALKTYSKAVTTAENSLKSAENQVSKLGDTIDKYTITAPISGQVITKSMKAGDKINTSGSNSNSSLALIYDLSELTFEMSIDELDISNVKVGQTVTVTADAFENRRYSGVVSNVSLNGTASNGVTTYPVVVTMKEMDGLLPGMNVTGVITLEESENCLYIPSNGLQRGNIVYVMTEDLKESNRVYGSGDGTGRGGSGNSSGRSAGGSEGGNSSGRSAGGSARSDAPDGFTAVVVETGIVSDDYVEIISGLEEGQRVYVKDAVISTNNMMMGGMGRNGGQGGAPGGSGQGGFSGGGPGGGAPGH